MTTEYFTLNFFCMTAKATSSVFYGEKLDKKDFSLKSDATNRICIRIFEAKYLY